MFEMLERIVESTPNRSKKDCVKCYKVRVCVKLLVCDMFNAKLSSEMS